MTTWTHSSGIEVEQNFDQHEPWLWDWQKQNWTLESKYSIQTMKDEAFPHYVYCSRSHGSRLVAKFIIKAAAQEYINLLEARK